MKREDLSSPYRNLAMAAIKHYHDMNDTLLNWKKISKFIGEKRFDNQIGGYTHEDIGKLVNAADVKYKAVILTLASTGMRREALVQIKPQDMEYFDYQLYNTTEAASTIKIHMQTRKRRHFHDAYRNLTGSSNGFSEFNALIETHFPKGKSSGLTKDNPSPLG